MGKVAYVLVGLMLAAVYLRAQTDAHLYSPGTKLERSEMVQLDTATRSVDVAMYSFTDRELAEELSQQISIDEVAHTIRENLDPFLDASE